MNIMKSCSKCGEMKSVSEFAKEKRVKSGISSRCKSCANKIAKEWRNSNPDKAKAIAERQRANPVHKVYMSTYSADHYKKNKAVYKEKATTYYRMHLEEKKAYDKERRERLHKQIAEYERCRKQLPHRKATHREYTRKRRMALSQASPCWITKQDNKTMKMLYQIAVIYSNELGHDFHVDHIVPLKGDNVCGLHVPENLQILPCMVNLRKHNSHTHISS